MINLSCSFVKSNKQSNTQYKIIQQAPTYKNKLLNLFDSLAYRVIVIMY